MNCDDLILGGICMADIKNCSKCGRMFAAEGSQKFCSRCRNDDDENFKKVREYVYDNPDANIPEVSEATEVDEEAILRFLRMGKLILKGDGMGLDCERCGKSISSGRFCDTCVREMKSEFGKAFGTDAPQQAGIIKKKTTNKMYTKRNK